MPIMRKANYEEHQTRRKRQVCCVAYLVEVVEAKTTNEESKHV